MEPLDGGSPQTGYTAVVTRPHTIRMGEAPVKLKTTTISILTVGLLASSAIGTAAQDGGAMVTGTVRYEEGTYFDTGSDGTMVSDSPGVTFSMSDTRLSGTAEIATFGVQAMGGDGFSEAAFGTDDFTLVNDEGSWSGVGTSALVLSPEIIPTVMEASWHLTGEGAYEGLSAYLTVEAQEFAEGIIVEGTSAPVE